MKYEKRADGRKFEETRPLKAEVGVIPNARGSARFIIGKTVAVAAVYGPRELHPRFLQNPSKGKLRCNYNMMAFSGSGNRVRPGPNRRSKEISMVIQKALNEVLDLTAFPKTVVDVYIELEQTDAGTRCAGICAAALALADAGFPMKDLIASVSCGFVGGQALVDLDYTEEAFEGVSVDIPIAMMPRTGKVTLLQLDGELTPAELKKALEFGEKGCQQIYEIQKKALRDKYTREEK